MLGLGGAQDFNPVGLASNDSNSQEPCIHQFYVYAILDFESGDFSELGSVEFVLSETHPPLPAGGKAILLLCVVQGSRTWYQRVLVQMDVWLAPGSTWRKMCCLRRREGLWRVGAAPPIRWKCWIGAGEVWKSLCAGYVERCWQPSGAHTERQILMGMGHDLVGEYHARMLQQGFQVDESFHTDQFGKTCFVKYLHALESSEVDHVNKLLLDAASGPERLDFRRELIVERNRSDCCIL